MDNTNIIDLIIILFATIGLVLFPYDIYWFLKLQKDGKLTTRKGTYTFTKKEKKING